MYKSKGAIINWMFNKDYVLSLMPKSSQEEKRFNKQWNYIQKEIISRAKRGFHTYNCWYARYDDKIYKLLKENNFIVYQDWQSGYIEIRW